MFWQVKIQILSISVIAFSIALAGCVESGVVVSVPQGSSTVEQPAATITRPGAVAIDAPARRQELSAANLLKFCPVMYAYSIPVILHDSDAPKGYGLNKLYLTVSNDFRRLGAACLRGSTGSCAAVKKHALEWARDSRLGGPKGSRDQPLFYNSTLSINMRLLSPMLSALGVVEQFEPLNQAEREILDRWIRRKVDQYEHGMRHEGYYKGGKHGTTARRAAHNHAIQSSIVSMSYGAWANNPKYFQVGIDQWFITLKSMRSDGSLPIETRRGARALFYVGRTLSALIQIAERAAVQGIDLYSFAPSQSKTLHHGVAFFLNAIENPELVLNYARANIAPGPSKNYKLQYVDNTTFGWVAPYMSRFPNHPNTRRLAERRARGHSAPKSYLTNRLDTAVQLGGRSDEWIGVDARCFYSDATLL